MNITEFKKIIKEAVKDTIREELKELLTEAVKIASTPEPTKPFTPFRPIGTQPVSTKISSENIKKDPLASMLEDTRRSMTSQEYHEIIGNTGPISEFPTPMPAGILPEQIGEVDLSMIPGMDKMKAILDAANEKDKFRKGIL